MLTVSRVSHFWVLITRSTSTVRIELPDEMTDGNDGIRDMMLTDWFLVERELPGERSRELLLGPARTTRSFSRP